MRRVVSFRVLVFLLGTPVLAGTDLVGASFSGSTVTIDETTRTDRESVVRSAGESPRPSRELVSIDPGTGFAADDTGPTTLNADDTRTLDVTMGASTLVANSSLMNVGALDFVSSAAPYDWDGAVGLAMLNTETGVAGDALARGTMGIDPIAFAAGSGLVAGEGALSTRSAIVGGSSFVGVGDDLGIRGSDSVSAAPVPEPATLLLIAFSMAAFGPPALIRLPPRIAKERGPRRAVPPPRRCCIFFRLRKCCTPSAILRVLRYSRHFRRIGFLIAMAQPLPVGR